MSYHVEIQLVATVTAAACALPGVFLVLRRLALLGDAISHSILVGIVIGFLITGNLGSPVLVVGAALTGLVTVSLVELLHRSGLVREDAAIGLVFPVLFSAGVILISGVLRDVHLDVDCVLYGALEHLKPLLVEVKGERYDLGPQSLYVMSGILLLNLLFITLFYKELKLATFDAGLAAALGFAPGVLHYALMGVVSITAVGAFDAVGSVLVLALLIAPAASAFLLTERLALLLVWSVVLAVVSALGGYWLAVALNSNIAASIATTAGALFGLIFVLAPGHGVLAGVRRRARQRWDFAQTMLAIHLFNHEGRPEAVRESCLAHLHEHLNWKPAFVLQVVRRAERQGLLRTHAGQLDLTDPGRQRARQALLG